MLSKVFRTHFHLVYYIIYPEAAIYHWWAEHFLYNIIGFITTDDFYGFYVTWKFGNNINIEQYYDWENGDISEDTGFLYQSLVDIVDGCKEIDFCNPSKENIHFFSTMDTGDYMQEMLDASVKKFNTRETLEVFGCLQ